MAEIQHRLILRSFIKSYSFRRRRELDCKSFVENKALNLYALFFFFSAQNIDNVYSLERVPHIYILSRKKTKQKQENIIFVNFVWKI